MTEFSVTITNRSNDKVRWTLAKTTVNAFIHNMLQRGHEVGPKDGTGIIAGTFAPGAHLEQKNLVSVTGLILDIDGKFRKVGDTIPPNTVLSDDGRHYHEVVPPEWLLSKLPYCGFAHSSHSHGPAHPKYRVILPLREPITPAEFMRLWFWVYEKVERKADPACKNPDRMFFMPRCTKEAQESGWPWVRALRGPQLSLSMVPEEFQIPDEFRYELERPSKKQGAHFAAAETSFRPTDAHKLLESLQELPIYEWASEYAEEVSREVWRGMATNIAAAVLEDESAHEAGAKVFHELSECDDHRYSYGDTEKTFRDALRSAQSPGPMTYRTLKLNGAPEDLDEGNAKSPVAHARYRLASKERTERPKILAPASSLRVPGAPGIEPVADDSTAPEDAAAEPPATVDDVTESVAATEEEVDEEGLKDLTLEDYKQTDILFDVQRNGWVLRETNPFNGETVWALDKLIRDEALNRKLVSLGLPRKQLEDWKMWIPHFDFRRCVYTTDQLLVRLENTTVFNTYKPTVLRPVPGNWDNIRALFLHLVNNDPDALEYVLDWCAAPLQKIRDRRAPANSALTVTGKALPTATGVAQYKNGTALVFRGDPGAGKGTAMEILQLCFGLSNCVTLGQDDLDGKFHSNLLDKLFVVGNEIMSASNRSLQTANKLKTWITDALIPCEGKYSDAGQAENNFNIVFTSNDERPMLVEKHDRRYSIFQSTRVPPHIIQPIRADLIHNQQEVSAFYDALLQRQVKMKYGELYQTEARTQVQVASAPTSERFAAALAEDGYLSVAALWAEGARNGEVREPTVSYKGEFYVLADTLMAVYKNFCSSIGAHPQHIRALTQAIALVAPDAEASFRIRLGNVQRRAWRGLPMDSPDADVLPLSVSPSHPTTEPGITPLAIDTENANNVTFGD